ncbi:hypothetical protein [Enterobacter quasihormaechei]|uniref:hypothetical protein n=1 Tax=Enterobacter quasihormaechei TaxID=2529382 RepID=UPI0013F16B3D|nr:hypothetical protein [Enterobacter quasihormaechei]MBK4272910.1 hypothetical protein [Enterobacter cloacae]MBK4652244.1 hypothetical protein [Enterobacter cloacae]
MNRFSLTEKISAKLLHLDVQDSAETFQEVLSFLQQVARKVTFLVAEFRSAAHFFFSSGEFADVQQTGSARFSEAARK